MLDVAALLHCLEKPLQVRQREYFRKLALLFRLGQLQLDPDLLADIDKVIIAKSVLADNPGDLFDGLRFRILF